ncbi:Uncharacterised protein [Macrococcoides caseolyticum]|uniref:hypothetical protein n=1 Tax=Macrococcoides caseolyticum TaxID=69966 RepID=UPI000E023809|nr:hypothetical protein [Macrococcus caseolyticus]STY75546.1 Uncharacterised protein [Macrococcus caseolyticus]
MLMSTTNPITFQTILPYISLTISIITIAISYLNRKDSLRPHIFVYLLDKRTDEGKISNEFILVENMGSYPARIEDVKIICKRNIYTNNGQYDFIDINESAKLNYVPLEKALVNKLKHRTILPGNDKKVSIELRDLSASNINLNSKISYKEANDYRLENLQSLSCALQIEMTYSKPVIKKSKLAILEKYNELFNIIN